MDNGKPIFNELLDTREHGAGHCSPMFIDFLVIAIAEHSKALKVHSNHHIGIIGNIFRKFSVRNFEATSCNIKKMAGFSVGELRKQWDWSLDVNYQWVQLQAIPDFDGSGIGRGNALKYGLYSKKKYGKGDHLTRGEGVGAGNYKGIAIEFLYLLTNNITVYQAWRQSVNQDPTIKPTFSYKQYEFEVIYGF